MLDQIDLLFFRGLDRELQGRDGATLDLFTLRVEEEWMGRIRLIYEFYFDQSATARLEFEKECAVLQAAELEYAEKEEYERSNILQSVRKRLWHEYIELD